MRFRKDIYTLARVAQLVGHHPEYKKIVGLIPGTGHAGGSQLMFHSHIDVSPPLLFSLKIDTKKS